MNSITNDIIEKLQATLRGEVILPDDSDYDDARSLWNAMIDKRPGAIARCSGTADGQRLWANAEQNADLFWVVCGGGGNFGIETLFDFKLHSVGPEGLSGLIVYPYDEAKSLLNRYRIDKAFTFFDITRMHQGQVNTMR